MVDFLPLTFMKEGTRLRTQVLEGLIILFIFPWLFHGSQRSHRLLPLSVLFPILVKNDPLIIIQTQLLEMIGHISIPAQLSSRWVTSLVEAIPMNRAHRTRKVNAWRRFLFLKVEFESICFWTKREHHRQAIFHCLYSIILLIKSTLSLGLCYFTGNIKGGQEQGWEGFRYRYWGMTLKNRLQGKLTGKGGY